jgi:hypothetical protein
MRLRNDHHPSPPVGGWDRCPPPPQPLSTESGEVVARFLGTVLVLTVLVVVMVNTPLWARTVTAVATFLAETLDRLG